MVASRCRWVAVWRHAVSCLQQGFWLLATSTPAFTTTPTCTVCTAVWSMLFLCCTPVSQCIWHFFLWLWLYQIILPYVAPLWKESKKIILSFRLLLCRTPIWDSCIASLQYIDYFTLVFATFNRAHCYKIQTRQSGQSDLWLVVGLGLVLVWSAHDPRGQRLTLTPLNTRHVLLLLQNPHSSYCPDPAVTSQRQILRVTKNITKMGQKYP